MVGLEVWVGWRGVKLLGVGRGKERIQADKGLFCTGGRREGEGGAAEKMGPAISRFARGGETASRDVEVRRGHTHYVWRSHGVYEGAGLLVRSRCFPCCGIGAEPFLTTWHSRHVSSYTISGHRFTHHSISLLLYRISLPASVEKNDSTSDGLPRPRLLDPSGTYILQASVRVQDGSKVETMTKGVNELLGLKETLKGVVELEIGDRLALDTRVR